MKKKSRCWISGHDWEILDTFTWHWSGNPYLSEYYLKVCLKCEQVVDEIHDAKERIKEQKKYQGSRKDRAKAIYDAWLRTW